MNSVTAGIAILVVVVAIFWAAKRKSKSDTGSVTPGTGPTKPLDPGTGATPGKEIR